MGCKFKGKDKDNSEYMFGIYSDSCLMTYDKSIVCENRLLFIGNIVKGVQTYGKMTYLDKNRFFTGSFKGWFEPLYGIIIVKIDDTLEKWTMNDDMTCTYETSKSICSGKFKYIQNGLPVMVGYYEILYFDNISNISNISGTIEDGVKGVK